ncbi:hypothetical protein ABKW28_11705 [Nocardioides sp. 31GB23]|uniref:hypothetical protein n=1 Tax=Nocardioides sp. 31GB23 TaxID=3156065 RepID=UPI0032B00D77
MTSTVRSVTVRMEADVAKYIADMRRAGAETDKAFRQVDLKQVDTRLKSIDASTKSMATSMRVGSVQVRTLDTDVRTLGRDLHNSGSELDRFSGRARILVDLLAMVGPAAVPIGAVAVPALAGLTSQLGFSVIAAGGAVLAFQGVGDALEAIEKARLDPTVENLQAARDAMRDLGPDAGDFVGKLQALRDEASQLTITAAGGLMPGLNTALDVFDNRLPELKAIIAEVTDATGDAIAGGAASLNGARWDDFFGFLEDNARENIDGLADSVGNLGHGLSELWMAFSPLESDFIDWTRDASESFDDWATRLDQTEGFENFLDYVAANGPQVADTVGALGGAVVDLVQAAAPLGGPSLQAIEGIAEAFSLIADSDAGTVLIAAAAGMATFNRANAIWMKTKNATPIQANIVTPIKDMRAAAPTIGQVGTYFKYLGQDAKFASKQTLAARASVAGFARTAAPTLFKSAALGGGLALAMSGVSDSMGLSNTTSLALMGSIAGPWGAAIGGGIGLALDFAAAQERMAEETRTTDEAIKSQSLNTMIKRYRDVRREIAEIADIEPWEFWKTLPAAMDGIVNNEVKQINKLDAAIAGLRMDRAWEQDARRAGGGIEDFLLGPLGKSADAFRIASLGADDYSASLQRLSDVLGNRGKWRAFQAAIDDARASLEDNGRTLDRTTEKGRANEAALDGIAATALAASESLKGMKRVEFLSGARKQFIEVATSMRMPIERAQDLADKLGLVGKQKPKPQVDADTSKADRKLQRTLEKANQLGLMVPKPRVDAKTAEADGAFADLFRAGGQLDAMRPTPRVNVDASGVLGQINAVRGWLNNIPDETVNVWVTRRTVTGGGKGPVMESARGNLFPSVTAYAQGGLDRPDRHLPEVATGGPVRIWAERETGGEAYLPLANDDRRPRARAIAEEVVGQFGGKVFWNARGGVYRSSGEIASTSGGRSVGALRQALQGMSIGGHLSLDADGRGGTLDARIERVSSGVVRRELDADAAFDDIVTGR